MSFEQLCGKISTESVRNVANHWNDVRGSRLMPSWSDINPSAIKPQLPFIWSWKFDIETGNFIGRIAGERIVHAHGGNLRGQDASTFFKDRGGDAMVERMQRVVRGPCYFIGEGAVFKHTRRIVIGERVILPLSTDGNTADGVFGVTSYDLPDLTHHSDDLPSEETGEFIDL